MTRSTRIALFVLCLIPCGILATAERATAGECFGCPKNIFCRPKQPHIKYKLVCPKPLCSPCEIENFGYYPTCWRAWPYPPNYCHCPVPPTIATAPCGPTGVPKLEELRSPQTMPVKPAL